MASYKNLSLDLTFLGNDLESGQEQNQSITSEHIVRNSVSIKRQLLNGLKSSSNQATLQIARDSPSIESIIRTDGDIKASLKDGEDAIFTGYISTSFSWNITESGKEALSITLEDTGTRLLGKSFINSGYHLFSCTAYNAIIAICDIAGVGVSSSCTRISDEIVKVVDSSTTCQDILSTLLYELGYVYYFDSLGELRVFKVDCSSTENLPVYDKDKLYVVSDKAVTLSKKIRTYKSARVEYKELDIATNYLIYRNTTGANASHKYCNLELGKGEYFDGTEVYTDEEWQEETLDTFREDALIEACNASSETEKVGSNDIIYVKDVVSEFKADDSNVTCSITSGGGPYIKILAHNGGKYTHHITRLDAYATVTYEKSTNIVRTDSYALESDESDTRLDESLEYVHTKALAQSHANLLGQYHRYCNSQYTFYSTEDIALGSIITLHDNMFSGLKVNVLVMKRTDTDKSDVVTYTAIGISVFDLTDDVWHSKENKGSPSSKDGEDGKSAYEIAVEHGYEGTEDEWVESLKGKPGEDGKTATTLYQYAMVDDGVTPGESDFSDAIPTGWCYGKKYWIRLRYTWSDGSEDTYSDAWLDSATNTALEESCSFELSADSTAYEIDKRSTESQTVNFKATQSGYDVVSFSWNITGQEGILSGESVSITLAKALAPRSVAAACTLTYRVGSTTGTLSKSVYLSSTDVTSYYECFGILSEAPSSAIDGDCYVLSSGSDYLPYIYSGGEWILIDDFSSNSTQASKIRDVIMSSGVNIPSTSTALYAYFRNLSAQNANLDYLSSSDITLKTSGKLHSDGYEQGTVRKLIDGDLDPETTKKGFYQDYDGNAEFFRADIYQANMNEGVLNNVTVNGKLNSATLVTQVTDVIGDSYRNKDITSGDKYWSETEVVNTVKDAIPHNEVVSCTGYFNKISFLQCIYVDDVSASHSLGVQTAWLATCDAKVTASGGTNLYVNGTQSFPVSVANKKYAFVLDYLGVGGQISGYSSAHYLEISCMKGTYYMVMPDFLDILSSTDGINWTVLKQDLTDLKTNTTSNWGKKFVCGTDRMIYLSYSGALFSSTDGVTWTQSSNFTTLVWAGTGSTSKGCCLNFCNGKFFALIEGGTYAFESSDGLAWSQSFKMPYTSCPAMVYYGGKYTLFSFSKYTGYNAVLAISSTDLSSWSAVVTDTEIYQLCDATVTNDGTYVLAGYAKTVSMGISFSKNLSSWSPASNCNGGFYYSSITTDGTNVVCGNSYNASQVSVKYKFGGTLSYKLNYSMGLHFLSQTTGAVFATPTTNWRHDTSYLNYSGTRLYYNSNTEVSTPTTGYVFCGMQKLVDDEWTDIASGEVFKFQSVSVTYTPVGGSARTVNAIQGITWNGTALTISRENLSPVVIDSSLILTSLSVSFVPVSMAQGNYTKSMFPLEEGMDIGAQDNKYHALYATTITGDYVYGAIWNDIADAVEVVGNVPVIPGKCYTLTRSGHSLSKRYGEKGTIGIHSDTFGFLLGKKGKRELNIAVGGFVLAYTDKVYKTGTPLTSSRNGTLTRMRMITRILHPERLVGTFYRKETSEFWYGIPVNGRHWIKVR